MYCPVYGCSSDSQKNPSGISFFSFPSGKSAAQQRRRKAWDEFCKRKEFDPLLSSRICSRHFSEDAYEPGHSPQFIERIECKETFRLRLKSDAVPTLHKPLLGASSSKPTACCLESPDVLSNICRRVLLLDREAFRIHRIPPLFRRNKNTQ